MTASDARNVVEGQFVSTADSGVKATLVCADNADVLEASACGNAAAAQNALAVVSYEIRRYVFFKRLL